MRSEEAVEDSMDARHEEDDAVEFVRHAYLLVLGREADVGGLANYVKELRSGASRQDVIASLAESEEGRLRPTRRISREQYPETSLLSLPEESNDAVPINVKWADLQQMEGAAFVRAAYCTILGREPDPEGRRQVVSELREGVARSRILGRMLRSTEYRQRRIALRTQAMAMLKVDSRISGATKPAVLVDTLVELFAGPVLDADEVDRFVSAAQASDMSKSRLVDLIRASRPARQRTELIRRIRRAAFGNSIASIPIVGSMVRSLLGFEGNSALEIRVRRIAYMLETLYHDRYVGFSSGDLAPHAEAKTADACRPGCYALRGRSPSASTGARDDAQEGATLSASDTQPRSAAIALRTLPEPVNWSWV